MSYVKKSAALCALLLMLSACGQSGPLYLPQDEPSNTQPEANPNQPTNNQPKGARN